MATINESVAANTLSERQLHLGILASLSKPKATSIVWHQPSTKHLMAE